MKFALKLALTAALTLGGAAYAETIALYNTGCSVAGSVCNKLTDNGVNQDSNWIGSGGYGSYVFRNAWPAASGPWVTDGSSSSSAWLRPTTGESDPENTPFSWTQTFTLSSGSYSNFILSGQFAADNMGELFLNGQSIGTVNGFGSWASFSTTNASYLQAGANTLEFRAFNIGGASGNPAGFRLEFSNASVDVSVPEPIEVTGAIIGLAGMMTVRRRKAA